MLRSTTLIKGFGTGDSITFSSWPRFSASPELNPFVWKRKPAVMAPAPALRKTLEKCVCGRRSSHSGTQTFAQELALAKPLKHNNNFFVKSSGLSLAKKASVAGVDIAGKKSPLPPRAGAA
jgi:hypothetical protein